MSELTGADMANAVKKAIERKHGAADIAEAKRKDAAAAKIREQSTWALRKLENRIRSVCQGYTAQVVVQALAESLYDIATTHGATYPQTRGYLDMVHQIRTADEKARAATEREEAAAADTP